MEAKSENKLVCWHILVILATWETDIRQSTIIGLSGLHSKFKVSLGNLVRLRGRTGDGTQC